MNRLAGKMKHSGFSGKTNALHFKVFIHFEDDHVEAERIFTDCQEADTYFEALCRTRTEQGASVIGAAQGTLRKYFRIGRMCPVERRLLNMAWVW
jgi:hypothetical protein